MIHRLVCRIYIVDSPLSDSSTIIVLSTRFLFSFRHACREQISVVQQSVTSGLS